MFLKGKRQNTKPKRIFLIGIFISLRKCLSQNIRGVQHYTKEITSSGESKYGYEVQRKLWTFTSSCKFGSGGDVFVSSTFGQDEIGFGQTSETPYASIQFAVNNRRPCQTIYIMEGLYRNKNFKISDNNGAVVNLNGVTDLKFTNYEDDCVIIQFDGAGGFVGGGLSNPVSNLEISGIEIIGPNEEISFQEAFDNRLLPMKRYKGRGIAIWAGHHIHIHDVIVHHCPASGIRVNKGDYVTIENSEVYSNTWWSSSAESAIVFAESVAIDENTETKMIISRNRVYDNINKIPYYNKNYGWDFSPIGGNLDCSSYLACKNRQIENCPWQCRYGKVTQDYIIDGNGVYITRNNKTYSHGKFELSYNECFGNGINGLVMHRTDRAMIKQNIIYNNGVVPRLDKPEENPQDWHKGCSGKSRQPYSGLVLNNAKDAKVWSNLVTARYEDDYAFTQLADDGNPSPVLAGGNNHACNGKYLIDPGYVVKFSSDPSKCRPESISSYATNHSCTKHSNYQEISCGDKCHLIQWPHTLHGSYSAPEAKENCANGCDNNDCKAFSLQMDYDAQNGDRMCFLYLESKEPSPNNCTIDPFNVPTCSYPTIDGQFFITITAAEHYSVKDKILD